MAKSYFERVMSHSPTPDFGNLTWVGWASTATDKRVFYLDHIILANDAIQE